MPQGHPVACLLYTSLALPEELLPKIIREDTAEAGVRQLERTLGAI